MGANRVTGACRGGLAWGGLGVAGVAFLEQVEVGADAQVLQGAGDPGGAQVQGPLLDVLHRGQHFG